MLSHKAIKTILSQRDFKAARRYFFFEAVIISRIILGHAYYLPRYISSLFVYFTHVLQVIAAL